MPRAIIINPLQSPSRQKSHGFVLHVYIHHARDFCYTWMWVNFASIEGALLHAIKKC